MEADSFHSQTDVDAPIDNWLIFVDTIEEIRYSTHTHTTRYARSFSSDRTCGCCVCAVRFLSMHFMCDQISLAAATATLAHHSMHSSMWNIHRNKQQETSDETIDRVWREVVWAHFAPYLVWRPLCVHRWEHHKGIKCNCGFSYFSGENQFRTSANETVDFIVGHPSW